MLTGYKPRNIVSGIHVDHIDLFLPICYLSGWLQKEMKTNSKSTSLKLKKRWFVLTHNSLDYYKSSERTSSKMGTLVLNSLCSVIQPDERVHRETGGGRQVTGKLKKGVRLNRGLDVGGLRLHVI